GGLGILAALIGSTLLWANLRNRYVWVVVLATAGFGLIGFWDDARKVKKRKGLTARTKFLMQLLLALGVLQIILWQPAANGWTPLRSEEHTSELQSRGHLVCRLLLEKKKKQQILPHHIIHEQ